MEFETYVYKIVIDHQLNFHKVPCKDARAQGVNASTRDEMSFNTPDLALYILTMKQTWQQGNLGTQRSTHIGSRTRPGPSMDFAMALRSPKYGPLYVGYIFAFYATNIGSRDSGDMKVNFHWVKDLPWAFNGPCPGPTIHLTWPFIYWQYFCILW